MNDDIKWLLTFTGCCIGIMLTIAVVVMLLAGCAHRPPAVQPPSQYPGPGHKTVQRPSSNFAHPGSVEWFKERKREAGL